MTEIPEDIRKVAEALIRPAMDSLRSQTVSTAQCLVMEAILAERQRSLQPILVGSTTIIALAEDGEVHYDNGQCLLAADSLHAKNPYRDPAPIIIGQESIQALAAYGEVRLENGVTLVAASNLFHADPYAREA